MSLPGFFRRTTTTEHAGGSRLRHVYVSFHKCATRYTEAILRDVCKIHNMRAATFDARHDRVPPKVLRRTDFLMLPDFSRELIDLDRVEARGLYVIRDPRDILVSLYFSHRYSHPLNHPEIERDRRALADRGVQEGLIWLLDESRFFQRIVLELDRWRGSNRFYETTFERLTAAPETEFTAALDHMGITLEAARLRDVLARHSFDSLRRGWAARNPGADVNHYRRGVAGDWAEHLVGEAKNRFRERHGALLVKLGYETESTW